MKHLDMIFAAFFLAITAALLLPRPSTAETVDTCKVAGYSKSSGTDPRAFFFCVYSARRWLLFPFQCAVGNIFSEASRRCVTAPSPVPRADIDIDGDFNADEGEGENEDVESVDDNGAGDRDGRALALAVTAEPCTCVDTCPGTGYFQSCCKNEKFLYCIWNARNNRWLLYPLSCKPGYEFDESKQTCVAVPAG